MNRSNPLPFDIDAAHNSPSDELEELAVAHALESMDSEERDEYVLHLAICGQCRSLVGDFQAVADVLPDSLDGVEASRGGKQAILSHALSDVENVPDRPGIRLVPPQDTNTDSGPQKRSRLAWPIPASIALAAGLIVAILGSLLWNLNIQNDLDEQVARNVNLQNGLDAQVARNVEIQQTLDSQSLASAEQSQVLRSIATGASVSLLSGTESAPSAVGRLVQDLQTGEVFLIVNNLPVIPVNQEFQVWHIAGGSPTSAGIFSPTQSTNQIVMLNVGFANAEAVGVSVEPVGGSPEPTGDIVLLGPAQ